MITAHSVNFSSRFFPLDTRDSITCDDEKQLRSPSYRFSPLFCLRTESLRQFFTELLPSAANFSGEIKCVCDLERMCVRRRDGCRRWHRDPTGGLLMNFNWNFTHSERKMAGNCKQFIPLSMRCINIKASSCGWIMGRENLRLLKSDGSVSIPHDAMEFSSLFLSLSITFHPLIVFDLFLPPAMLIT